MHALKMSLLATLSLCFCIVFSGLSLAANQQPLQPIYDIPRLDGITIDGQGNDWADRGFTINYLVHDDGQRCAASDLSAVAKIGWNDEGLLILMTVKDNEAIESGGKDLWMGDCVELYLDNYNLVCSPGLDPQHPSFRMATYIMGKEIDQGAQQQKEAASRKIPGGYQIEAILPWAVLNITPTVGREVTFQAYVDDRDSSAVKREHWFPQGGTVRDAERMHCLRLTTRATAPLKVAIISSLKPSRRVGLDMTATADLQGKTVKVFDGKKLLATATLKPVTDGVGAELAIPMPKFGQNFGPLSVVVQGEAPLKLLPIDLTTLCHDAIENDEFRFHPFVFNGPTLPKGEFVDPSLMEDMIGRYTVTTTYYDAASHQVTSADTPGRYGAVVTVTGDTGTHFTRYYTLYRVPEELNWDTIALSNSIELPKELGIDADVAKEQTDVCIEYTKSMLRGAFENSQDAAIGLAGLAEMQPNSGKATWSTNPWARNDRWWAALQRQHGELMPYTYIAHLPDGYDGEPQKHWPLLVVLHGAGQRGLSESELASLYNQFKLLAFAKTDYPCVVITPSCPVDESWSPAKINLLIDKIMEKYRIDEDRIYLTGFSMGGFGTFATAVEYPERFAAVAPVCGGWDPGDAPRLKNLPIWVFHGDSDTTVPFANSEKMVNALKAIGGDVQFHIYPGGGHTIYTDTYNDPKLLEWLLAHKRRH